MVLCTLNARELDGNSTDIYGKYPKNIFRQSKTKKKWSPHSNTEQQIYMKIITSITEEGKKQEKYLSKAKESGSNYVQNMKTYRISRRISHI